MPNKDIRNLMKINRIYLWEIAQLYGCTESTLSKKLRIELSKEDKEKIIDIINQIKSNSFN